MRSGSPQINNMLPRLGVRSITTPDTPCSLVLLSGYTGLSMLVICQIRQHIVELRGGAWIIRWSVCESR